MLALKFRSWLLLHPTLNRRRTSNAAGPQSSSMRPVAGMLNGPSVLFSVLPRLTLVKSDIRRQFQRALAGPAGPPGPPPIIITRSPIMMTLGAAPPAAGAP